MPSDRSSDDGPGDGPPGPLADPANDPPLIDPADDPTAVVTRRCLAQLVDLVAMTVQVVAVAVLVGGGNVGLIAGLVTTPLYGGLLERYWHGQTLGKRLVGIRVVTAGGDDLAFGRMLARNLTAPITPPLLYVVSLAVMLRSARHQRVLDHALDTLVVRV